MKRIVFGLLLLVFTLAISACNPYQKLSCGGTLPTKNVIPSGNGSAKVFPGSPAPDWSYSPSGLDQCTYRCAEGSVYSNGACVASPHISILQVTPSTFLATDNNGTTYSTLPFTGDIANAPLQISNNGEKVLVYGKTPDTSPAVRLFSFRANGVYTAGDYTDLTPVISNLLNGGIKQVKISGNNIIFIDGSSLWLSTDLGASYSEINLPDPDFSPERVEMSGDNIAVEMSSNENPYLIPPKYFMSNDRGASFQTITTPSGISSFESFTLKGDNLIVNYNGNLEATQDRGATYTPIPGPGDDQVPVGAMNMGVTLNNGNIVQKYWTPEEGFYYESIDMGASYKKLLIDIFINDQGVKYMPWIFSL